MAEIIGRKCCGTCAHVAGNEDPKATTGYCRRYPPIVTSRNGETPSSQFPPVHLSNFCCGEFQRIQN